MTPAQAKTVRIHRTAEEAGDLVGAAEAAEILKVERTRIARWRDYGWMPDPIALLRSGPVYLRAEIEALRDKRAQEAATA